jgi:Protein of unknown function (DUF1353)
MFIRRRDFLGALGGFWINTDIALAAGKQHSAESQRDRWMRAWMLRWARIPHAPGATLHLSRFKDPTYYLLRPISWSPNPGQTDVSRVDVPVGFVTDFASIPRIFWSLLRPDGDYTYPAIVHDYLYWTQERSKEEADLVFKLAMEDFKIEPLKAGSIYRAVKQFGGAAWAENARLRANGEHRILKQFPEDPTITWQEWKVRPNVFS